MNKILILKNDRTGDLFTSIPTINLIFNKHISDDIELFLSKINHKFSFLFKDKKIKVINIDLNFFDKINIQIKNNSRPLLIFPQGTRVKLEDEIPFKKGVGRIYDKLNLPCVPVALNSGKVWPKNSFIKYKGDISISFLEPIMPGKNKDEFVKELESSIYAEIRKL